MTTHAIAIFKDKYVQGHITFTQKKNMSGTYVKFDLSKMKKDKTHAVHIHEYGDMRKGCASLGSHWNPRRRQHGSIELDGKNRHSGDLINNLITDGKGRFRSSYYDPLVKLRGPNNIFGRSVVIHEGVDDLGRGGFPDSKKTGHAGGRMACAIIVHYKD